MGKVNIHRWYKGLGGADDCFFSLVRSWDLRFVSTAVTSRNPIVARIMDVGCIGTDRSQGVGRLVDKEFSDVHERNWKGMDSVSKRMLPRGYAA